MILSSLLQRRLVFNPLQVKTTTPQTCHRPQNPALSKQLRRLFAFFYGRRGIFGVESPYFDLVIFGRECIDMALQTYQAYRLSRYVPRLWLNRVYVALLVLNCWSTPLIHIIFKHRVMLSRLLLLLDSALLDLFSTMGLAVILLTSYYRDYDYVLGGFPMQIWYNDEWAVNFFNEFKFVLVVSWMDLLSRLVFYTGTIVAIENIKELLRQAPSKQKRRVGPSASFLPGKRSIGPLMHAIASLQPPQRRFDRIAHVVLIVWGLMVLCLHAHADTRRHVTQCLMQVRPWTAARPTCVLLAMDCHINDVRGHEDDINPYWELVDPITVTRIVIRHCPELHMPPTIQRFSHLDTLKLYNTTVVDWSDSAALTTQHHPVIGSLFVVRTNFTDGQLPPGVMSSDFPQSVYDIEFSVTNLHTLPDDLDTKWPHVVTLYLEINQLDHFPSVLSRIQPTYLSLSANQLTEFPIEALQNPNMNFLSLSANPISTLEAPPQTDVTDIGALKRLKLLETNISSLPWWMDPLLGRGTLAQPSVNLYNSPMCTYINELESGTRTHFPALGTTPQDKLASMMMLSDVSSFATAVTCKSYYVLLYPLASEDEWSSLTPQPVLYSASL
ncbi:hypothetical protein Poli38472_008026 [Pythium oligandrum]|uniref:Uncharacterized protein n=1 Tax=Pythium oligandrum TaxID=41045 RepID=A0A8K1FLL6_PYTOL|nr:hypothetical protein Poli38472_008026 [Pythium oligandrum]|eukprot:TMW65384.1 hypothetical protein Poli38472_008026 [Pythium oligandrum]